MGDPGGFLKTGRKEGDYRPVCDRVLDWREVAVPGGDRLAKEQASRCMDCGTPFCHWGCPVGNYVPEWNDLVYRGQWRLAFELLDAANNLPEITGRLCPAPCEYACVLGINDDPVTVRENEQAIIERAWREGLIAPRPPLRRTGRRVAVVGSGPSGLSAAAQLNRAGHLVTVFERAPRAGGILRYGIPDFKLDKSVIDRRLDLMKAEGVEFRTGVDVGDDLPPARLLEEFDAVLLAGGCRVPRDLPIEGRELGGIHFAMDYLAQANLRAAGEPVPGDQAIDAKGLRVVVIGGGDTGADCLGTAHRQGAECVIQIEVLPRPAECRTEQYPWPRYPMLLKTGSSHEEGGERHWAVLTKRFAGEGGRLKRLECVRVEFPFDPAKKCAVMREVPGSGFTIEADLAILAVGFVGARKGRLLEGLGVQLDGRGNVAAGEDFRTSAPKVFAAGDMRRGQSLIVWAIAEGRRAARAVDLFLSGSSELPAF